MKNQDEVGLKPLRALITLLSVAVLLCVSASAQENAAQKSRRVASASRTSRIRELVRIDQLKEVFQRNSGKVRLVALVSPT